MKVVVKRAGQMPEIRDIKRDLEAYHEIVGGYIECVRISDGIILVCNDEGKLKGLEPNFILGDDIIVGDVFFVGVKGEDFTSLSDQHIKWTMKVMEAVETIRREF